MASTDLASLWRGFIHRARTGAHSDDDHRSSTALLSDTTMRDCEGVRLKDAQIITQGTLTRSYLLALALIAALTIAGGAFFTSRLELLQNDGTVINMAGAQRMLSQRVAAFSTDLLLTDPEVRHAAHLHIKNALERMSRAHEILSQGPNAPALKTLELQDYYFAPQSGLGAAVGQFMDLADKLLGSTDHVPVADPELVAAFRNEALGSLLQAFDRAVLLHQEAKQKDLSSAIYIHKIIVGFALMLLVVEALFIFRPMTQKITKLAGDLEREARIDALTGLLNRRAFTQALANTISRGEPVAVMAIDLDHFKETNDSEGHEAGDALLRAAGERLRRSIRPTDVVGRIGGDEFAAFLVGVSDHETAANITERVRTALHEPVEHHGRSLRLGATLGFALAPADAKSPALILRVADEALLRAKKETRGSVERARPEDADRLLRATAIVKAFDGGLVNREGVGLTAHLQPIVRLGTASANDEPVSFEALARWNHPELGLVPPAELLDAIGPSRTARLGYEVRAHALAQYKALLTRIPTAARLALNLSAAEATREDIGLSIYEQVTASGVNFDKIEIEITEEILLERVSDRTLDQFAALRGRGARLILDDFGTGNSGLSQLLRLPLDGVKLDKRFIQRLGADQRAEEIVRATVSLARGLGLDVVAEGVETDEQAALAAKLGCDTAQGYLYAKPMPVEELERWLLERAKRAQTIGHLEKPLALTAAG